MSTGRKSTNTQMADLTIQTSNQNDKLKNIMRVANQAEDTQNAIQAQLVRQRGIIANNIDTNKQIKQGLIQADKTTSRMRLRNFCIKLSLFLGAILLFICNIGLIVWKITSATKK